MKIIKIYLICMLAISKIWAQSSEQIPEQRTMTNASAGNSLYGKLVDKSTGKSIVAGSVQIYAGSNNRDSLFDGMLSKPNGEFGFRKLPDSDSILLVVSALGYVTYEQVIANDSRKNGQPQNFKKDLGKILLQTEIKQSGEVVVTSSRPAYEMGIDRKVFDVSKSLLATGGTAIDIMKSIPSVSVDIEGNVQLRNSTPQIFVDGRPTILTLDQIPADHVDKIELITNPSAKFDAASSGGIINVVLKKNKRIGLNGVANISAGVPELLSGNLTVNLRQGKFNFFTTLSHNQSGGTAKGQTLRENKKGGVVTDYFNQYSENQRKRNFNTVRFGTDFFINNRNTITVSQDFTGGKFTTLETQNQEYLHNDQTLIYSGLRTADGAARFDRGSSRINYKYTFPKEGKELTADASYNYGERLGNSDIITHYYNPDGSEYRVPNTIWTEGTNKENQFTFQSDYVNPVNESTKIEAGIRSYHNKFASLYNAYTNENGQTVKSPLSNNYEYIEKVNAAYFTYSYKKKSYSYQLGLRGEYSLFDGELIDSAYKFGYEYPKQMSNIWDALFPSFFVTKKVSESDELQFNFSRRIRRPQFWQLNPFVEIIDPANLRQGNPDLNPEFINSFEVNYSRTYKKGNFLAAVYFRNNPDDITEYSDTITDAQYQQFGNAAIDPNAILNTYINANTTNRYGAEFTVQHKFSKAFDLTPTINFQYRTVNATVKNIDLSNAGFNWEAKLIANYKIETKQKPLFNNLGFQLILDYESPEIIPQGRTISEFVVDIAMRKDFMKNKKASLTFAVSDLFNGNRWGTTYDTEQFYQESYRRWSVRSIRLTFSYKFGDTNFSLFSGNKGGNNDDD